MKKYNINILKFEFSIYILKKYLFMIFKISIQNKIKFLFKINFIGILHFDKLIVF